MRKTNPDTLNVLLVDDEPKVINGLERNIGVIEDNWDINVAYSGSEALKLLENESADVIVSDLRMPEMNGAQFLAEAKILRPESIRFILSGYADEDLLIKATSVAHRYLTKPCESKDLIGAIRQVYQTRKLMSNSDIIQYVTDTGELHTDNSALQKLLELTNQLDCDLQEIDIFIQSQPTVHASILHVANSAFFGASREIESISDALQILGVDYVRSLAMLELSKSKLNLSPRLKSMADALIAHCVETSQFSFQLKPLIKNPKLQKSLSSLSLLHDLGKLVFLVQKKDDYAALWQESIATSTPLWKLEKEHYGCDHAGIGAYLFDLWGLPEALIRGVAWHHEPLNAIEDSFCPVSLLHIANFGAHQMKRRSAYFSGELDQSLANQFSLSPQFYNDLN